MYFIAKKGEEPGNEGAENLGGICAAWAKSKDKDQTEVIAVSYAGSQPIITRLSAEECERRAHAFNNPIIPHR